MLDNKKDDKNKKDKPNFPVHWIYIGIVAILLSFPLFESSTGAKKIEDWQFWSLLDEGDFEKVIIVGNQKFAEVYVKETALEKKFYKDKGISDNGFMGNTPQLMIDFTDGQNFENRLLEHAAKLKENNGTDLKITSDNRTEPMWKSLFSYIVLFALLIGVWVFMMRKIGGGGGPGGQIFNIGKSKAQLFDKNAMVKTNFNDVAGLDGAKMEVMEIVDFLKNPKKFTKLGAQIPKGALLVGPPGTGKTLLAKAVAGEAKVPFFSLSGSDFVEMFVGVGASRVRDLFKTAKEKAPCIIFIDEIDAIGRARGKNNSFSSNDERENTLNQLLTEMDGFETNSGIIILAATNRADVLDRALMRPGRFDRVIYVDMPDINERKEIFEVHLKKLKLDQSVDVDFLSRQTPGFSGADIANICNEAALIAARGDKEVVGKQDFLDAVDRIIGGLEKKNKIITPQEKRVIAFHEAGHAAVSWLVEHASPLVKVTIVPRGQSLGAAWYLPEERSITTKAQIIDEMCAALGGRAAEQVIFGEVSTGALSDLEKITKQAYAMISVYGLNEKIGNVSFYDSSGQSEYSFNKPYSDKTAEIIDQEVKLLIDNAYERTKKILEDNRDKLTKLAEKLLEKEVIFKEDLEEIFGKRPYGEQEEEIKSSTQTEVKTETVEPTAEVPVEENQTENSESKESEQDTSVKDI